jgi:hypothetical protein
MTEKYFGVPFAASGDKAVIPVPAQPGGSMSFTEGFGLDYERNPATDPQAKRIPRDETNQLYYDVTNELRILQVQGVPDWTPASLNGGSPVSYDVGARVRHSGQNWESLTGSNTVEPGTDPAKWVNTNPYNAALITATQPEVTGAVVPSAFVSPLTLASALRTGAVTSGAATRSLGAYTLTLPGAFVLGARARVEFTAPDVSPAGPLTLNVSASGARPLVTSTGGVPAAGDLVSGRTYGAQYDGANWVLVPSVASQFVSAGAASESVAGITRYATAAEANALALLTVALTPGRLPIASVTQRGVSRAATGPEASAGTLADVFISPATLAGITGGLVAATRTVTAGAGLTGGGNLTSDRTFDLGSPLTISASSTNAVGADDHQHALADLPISKTTGLQTALDAKAPVNNAVFTGSHVVPWGSTIARLDSTLGARLVLERPTSGTTFTHDLVLDVVGDELRVFENGGLFRGTLIPLSAMSSGPSGALWSSISLPMATAAQYRANTAGNLPLTPAAVWSAAALVTLTQAATIAVDLSEGINFTTTMNGNRTLGAPSNAKPGQSGVIEIRQDGTGGRTLAFASAWVFPGGADPTLSTAAGARDVLAYTVLSSGVVLGSLLKGVA